MKLILIPKNIDEITKANDLVDGFIIGVESLSTNMPFYVNLNEIDFVDGTKYAKAVQDFFPKNPIMIMPMNDMALQIVKKT